MESGKQGVQQKRSLDEIIRESKKIQKRNKGEANETGSDNPRSHNFFSILTAGGEELVCCYRPNQPTMDSYTHDLYLCVTRGEPKDLAPDGVVMIAHWRKSVEVNMAEQSISSPGRLARSAAVEKTYPRRYFVRLHESNQVSIDNRRKVLEKMADIMNHSKGVTKKKMETPHGEDISYIFYTVPQNFDKTKKDEEGDLLPLDHYILDAQVSEIIRLRYNKPRDGWESWASTVGYNEATKYFSPPFCREAKDSFGFSHFERLNQE